MLPADEYGNYKQSAEVDKLTFAGDSSQQNARQFSQSSVINLKGHEYIGSAKTIAIADQQPVNMTVDISHQPVNAAVSQSNIQLTEPDQGDNFNDIEHQAAMALLIEDSISSAEGRDNGPNRLANYCNSYIERRQRPGVVYTTLQGYTSPPTNDLPLMIASEALPVQKKELAVRPKVFNLMQKRQLGGLSSPSPSPSNSSLMNISQAKIIPVAERVRSQLKFGRIQPSPLAINRQQPSRSVLGSLVSDTATTPMQDHRMRSPDAQTLKRDKQGFESTATMLLLPPKHFQITPAVRITSYGDSLKTTQTQACTNNDLYRDGVKVIEVRPIDRQMTMNTGGAAITQENASQVSQGRNNSQCEVSNAESKLGSVYYDSKRFKGQLKQQNDSKKTADPELIRLIQQKEREMAAHMEQIYKFDKKPEQQEATMYLEPTQMGQTTKHIIKSKKPLSLTQRGELVKKSKSKMSIGPASPTPEKCMTHTHAVYSPQENWKEQSPDVTFMMDPDNCNSSDPKYVTYFPPTDQNPVDEDLNFELPLGCGRGFKSFATQPIKLHQKPKLASLISRSPSHQSSHNNFEQTEQLLSNLRISPAKKSPKKYPKKLIKLDASQISAHAYKSTRKVDKWLDAQLKADYSHLLHNVIQTEIINAHRTLDTPSKHFIYGIGDTQTDSQLVTTGHRSRKSETKINQDLGHFHLNEREKDETVTSRLLVEDREESQAYLQPMRENTPIINVFPKLNDQPHLIDINEVKIRGGKSERILYDQTLTRNKTFNMKTDNMKTDNMSEDKTEIDLEPLANMVANDTIFIKQKPNCTHQMAVQADLASGSNTPHTRKMYNTHFHSPSQKQFKPPFVKQLHEVAIQEQSEQTQSTVGHLTRNRFNTGKRSAKDLIIQQMPEHLNVMMGSRQKAFLNYSGDLDQIVNDNFQAISLTKIQQQQQKQSVKVYMDQIANDIIREADMAKVQTPVSRWDAGKEAITRTTEEGPRLNTVSDIGGMRPQEININEGGNVYLETQTGPPPTVGGEIPQTVEIVHQDAFMQNDVHYQNKPKVTIKQMQQEEIPMYQSGQIYLNKHQLRLELPKATSKRDPIHVAAMKSAMVFRNTGNSILKHEDNNTDSQLVMGGVSFHQSLFAKQKRMQDSSGSPNMHGPDKPKITLVMGGDTAPYELALAGFKPGTEKQESPQQIFLSNSQNYLDKSNPQVFLNRDLQGDLHQQQVPLIKKKLTKSNRKQQKSNAKLAKGTTVEYRGEKSESPKPLIRSPSPSLHDHCNCKPQQTIECSKTSLKTREIGVGAMSNPATAMQIKQLSPSPSLVLNDLANLSQAESQELAYLYADRIQGVQIKDGGYGESTSNDLSQSKLQQAQFVNNEIALAQEILNNSDLRDQNSKYQEIHSKLAESATVLQYTKELKNMIQSTELKPIQLPTHHKLCSPLGSPGTLSPTDTKQTICEDKSSKISKHHISPGITAHSNSTLHQPTAEFNGIAPKTAQSAESKEGIIKGTMKLIPASNSSEHKDIFVMREGMPDSATEEDEQGTMRFSQILSKQDSLDKMKRTGIGFLQNGETPKHRLSPRKMNLNMQVTTKTVFMKNKSSEKINSLIAKESEKNISIQSEKSTFCPKNVQKRQKSLDMYDLSQLINMKVPSVHQIQQIKPAEKRKPIDKILTEQQLTEFRKIIGQMRCQNQSQTSRYIGKKNSRLQRNFTNTTSYHNMGRANQRPSAFAKSKGNHSPEQSPTSSGNPITRDISDANFFPAGPRFHSSLKSYGEMVLIQDASQTIPKRSISPAPSMLQSKFCFSPMGTSTPYVFNDALRIKESMKRTNQLMNAFNIPTSPYSTAEPTDLS